MPHLTYHNPHLTSDASHISYSIWNFINPLLWLTCCRKRGVLSRLAGEARGQLPGAGCLFAFHTGRKGKVLYRLAGGAQKARPSTLLFVCLSSGCQGMWCSLLGRRGTAKERVWLGAWLAHLGVSPRLQWKKTFRFPFADEGSPGRGQATEKGAKGISNKTGVWRVADDKHQFSTKWCSLGREICQHIANYNLLHNHRLPARILYPSQPIIYCTATRPGSTMHSQPMCDVSMAIGGYADTTFSHGFRMLEIAYCFWAQISPTSWLLNDWLKDFWWDLSDTC